MTLFMSHDCPKCGGELLIDTDKLIYSCDFCGMTFDFDYFETANLLSVANRALGRGEFNAARKMFEELSEKDPHDAAVLRGLLFCDEKIESLYSLDIEDFPIDTEDKHFTYSIEHADHIGLQYFGHIKNAAEISKKYQESVKEDQACQKDCNDIGSKILDKTRQIDAYCHNMTNAYQVTSSLAKSDDNISDLIGLVIVLLFFFAAVGIRIGVEYFGLPFLFLSLAVIIPCVLIYKAFKANKIAKMKKDLAALIDKEKELRRKLDESKAKSDKIQDGYIAEIQEAMNLEKTMFGEVER